MPTVKTNDGLTVKLFECVSKDKLQKALDKINRANRTSKSYRKVEILSFEESKSVKKVAEKPKAEKPKETDKPK